MNENTRANAIMLEWVEKYGDPLLLDFHRRRHLIVRGNAADVDQRIGDLADAMVSLLCNMIANMFPSSLPEGRPDYEMAAVVAEEIAATLSNPAAIGRGLRSTPHIFDLDPKVN